MSLNKEIWIDQLKNNYYPEASFLTRMQDLSALVEYDKINLTEVGLDPDVLINNTTYPIAVTERTDNPLSIELQLFETTNTLVRRPESVELSYDKVETVVRGHRNALLVKSAEKGAHAISPQSNTAKTPVIATTGADNGDGKKRLTLSDLLKLKRRFDEADYPQVNRILVLNPYHIEDLLLANTEIFKEIANHKKGEVFMFAGFEILEFTRMARYNSTTLEKVPFGSASAGTDTNSSFAFISEEVMKADGDVHMYATIDDPKERATTLGFDKRFICMPYRNQGIGAIVSASV